MDAEKIAGWHEQFVPAAPKGPTWPIVLADRLETIEHPASEDGVFAPPVPVEEEPEHVEGEERAG